MTVIAFIAGLLLPWLLGMAGLAAVRHRTAAGESAGDVPWIVGAGYFAGVFALTLWMRLLSGIGVTFSWSSIALPLLLFTAALAYVSIRRDRSFLVTALPRALRSLTGSPGLAGGARWLWWLLVAWLVARFTLLALEVTWQPLYPWDAWIQWATKARVWYELGHIVPFARSAEWFAANGAAYFDASPDYPPTVPLMQVWANIALGQWDDALMNWPWWQIAVALSLAVFGGLRRIGLAPVSALVGTFLVASIPLANVHVALAGYADFPLAAFFTVAVLAFLCWNKERRADDAGLALFLLFACTQIKNPGLFWALTLVPGVIVALFPTRGLRIAGAMFGIGVMLLLVLAQTNFTVFLYRLHLDFDPGWQQLGESYFLMGNWNLLWYGLIAVALLLRRDLFARPLAPFTIVMVGGLLFLFLVFGFTNAREWLAQQTTVNRATLHLAPLMTVYLVIAFHAFAQRWMATHAATEPVAAASAATTGVAPAVTRPPIQVPAPPSIAAPVPAMASAGRNDPCPCGSGKRYKHCHGAAESIAAPVPDASADAHFHRAMQAHQRGDLVAAERDYREALAIVPDHPHATHYLGVIHYQRQRLADALPLLQQAVLRIPHEPEFHNNLGLALAAADRAAEAAAAHRQAIALRPDHAGAWNNLGLALQAANELPQAIEAFRTALRLQPDFREAHWNLALALLLQGEYREGFREYEWRLDIAALGKVRREYPGPRWEGADPAGKTLLLTREQGLGDTLQFARFASTLAERGARVIMEVPDPLRRLMASVPGVASVCGADDPLPPYDAHAPLLSIPGLVGITGETIPRAVPYITPGTDEVAAIMPLLERYRGTLKVGLAWAGSRAHWNDRRRSCPLAALSPLLAMPGITWFSLQKDDGEDEIPAVPAAAGLVLLDARKDFDRKAALVAALDLVISVDTSNAHLAGALARPLWVLLPSAPDWRWQLDRQDSPWYPTARLFRQPRAGDWRAVVAAMGEALRARAHAADVSPA